MLNTRKPADITDVFADIHGYQMNCLFICVWPQSVKHCPLAATAAKHCVGRCACICTVAVDAGSGTCTLRVFVT